MADPTAAARKRRFRARQKAANDPVRAFLLGIVADLKAATADPKVKVEPWSHSRAATATSMLEDLDRADTHEEDAGVRVQLNVICLAHGAVTDEDREDLIAHHDEKFRRWSEDPANLGEATTAAAKSAKIMQAEASLAWADGERVAGRASSPIIAQGLRSTGVLIRARSRKEARSLYARFTSYIYTLSMAAMSGHGEPPYGANEP